MTKNVKICLSIPLRDFAAFEDLAAELNCPLEVLELTPVKGPEKPEAKTTRGRYSMNQETTNRIKAFYELNSEASAELVKEALELPHSVATILRVRNGGYDNATPKGKHKMTPEVIAQVKEYWAHHKDAVAAEVKEALDLPHGLSTIQKVHSGYYD